MVIIVFFQYGGENQGMETIPGGGNCTTKAPGHVSYK